MSEHPVQRLNELLSMFGKSGEGWAGLEETGADEASAHERWQKAMIVARPFMTDEGRQSLGSLRADTLGQATWDRDLGLLNGVANGLFREGQNSIIRYIEQCIEIAAEGPPTRGTEQ